MPIVSPNKNHSCPILTLQSTGSRRGFSHKHITQPMVDNNACIVSMPAELLAKNKYNCATVQCTQADKDGSHNCWQRAVNQTVEQAQVACFNLQAQADAFKLFCRQKVADATLVMLVHLKHVIMHNISGAHQITQLKVDQPQHVHQTVMSKKVTLSHCDMLSQIIHQPHICQVNMCHTTAERR